MYRLPIHLVEDLMRRVQSRVVYEACPAQEWHGLSLDVSSRGRTDTAAGKLTTKHLSCQCARAAHPLRT